MRKTWRTPRVVRPNFAKEHREVCPATRFFDQLSFIGDEVVGCFVLETSQGLVMLDCMDPDQRSIDIIEQGFRDLGLDIRDLCAIVLTHGHGDHYGRADYFKEKYGAKLYLSEIDYNLAKTPCDWTPWPEIDLPVDHFLQDGEDLVFGDTTIHAVFTPGHTMGCFSFIVPVTDEGRPHHMGMWGGSSLIQGSDAHAYLESWKKFDAICRDYHVDGEISAHTSYDMGIQRLQLVRQIVDGVPNPFVLGEEGYHYYHRRFYHMAEQELRTEK